MNPAPRITAEGDAALTVRFADVLDADAQQRASQAARTLAAAALPGNCEVVPSYVAVTVAYDPLSTSFEAVREAVQHALDQTEALPRRPWRTVAVPVCYGCEPSAQELGPDLAALASHCGLAPTEAARLHADRPYRIDMLGFMPGFAYLSGLDTRLRCPRLATPRTAVPAGSVGIGNNQTGVYPLPSPGGWHLIGRTPARLFDPDRSAPIPYQPGDYLRFEPIDYPTFCELAAAEAQGASCLRIEEEAR